MHIQIYYKEYKASDGYWYPTNNLVMYLWKWLAHKQYGPNTESSRIASVELHLW